ncbi:hypothetical protein [Streptomyces boninensis]|uniref:hypothetical protein n=1 Tax=Streptomyces boninensis TaxID=2039455 RepID=UPI003B219749
MTFLTKIRKAAYAAVISLALVAPLAACGQDEDGDGGGTAKPGASKSQGKNREQAGDWPAEKAGHGQPRLRALISAQGSGELSVVDIASGKTEQTLKPAGQSRPVTTEDGTHVLLPQGEQGVTHLVDAGIRWHDHGDHKDPRHEPARIVGQLKGDSPSHVVPHGEHVTVFDDGTGKAEVLHVGGEHASTKPERELTTKRPHHGVAVTLDSGEMIASLPGKTSDDPATGVAVYDKDNRRTDTFAECPGLHGEYAVSDKQLLFGCEDGVLVLERKGGGWDSSKIDNPEGTGDEEHVSSFVGQGAGRILGTFGDKAMVAVDLKDKKLRRIDLPADRGAYAWDPYWNQGLALTANGELHAIDPKAAKVTHSSKVTSPFKVSADWTKNQHSLAPGEKAVYLTDPYTSALVEAEVSKEGFQVSRTKKLDRKPYAITVLGMAD